METNSVEDTLKERGEVYGDYKGGNVFRVNLMKLIQQRYKDVHGEPMELEHEYFIYDIVLKLSRLSVTPTHKDSWLDIAGYATLIKEALNDSK